MSEYKEKKIHRTIRLPNFYEKIDLLDSLTHGGVRGRGNNISPPTRLFPEFRKSRKSG